MNKLVSKFGRKALAWLPFNSHLFKFCQAYVSRHERTVSSNIEANGELRFMQQYLGDCRMVFDVGANIGTWAWRALNINPQIDLHCFEPGRQTYRHLLANNFPPNVHCNNIGLSSSCGEQELYVFERNSALNSLYRRTGLEDGWKLETQKQSETIKLSTLDTYCKLHDVKLIDLLKVDVEGHELEVFKGGTGLFQQQAIRMVQFEYGGCNIDSRVLLKDLFNFLQPSGYRLYKILPHGLQPVARYDTRLENFQYQNWLASLDKL